MLTSVTGWAPRLNAGAWLHWFTAILAAVTGGLLAWAAAVPAASAAIIPIPGEGGYGPSPAEAGGTITVITAGGMPGWQITLIAVTAALVAATVAVVLDRTRARRRPPSPPDDTSGRDVLQFGRA